MSHKHIIQSINCKLCLLFKCQWNFWNSDHLHVKNCINFNFSKGNTHFRHIFYLPWIKPAPEKVEDMYLYLNLELEDVKFRGNPSFKSLDNIYEKSNNLKYSFLIQNKSPKYNLVCVWFSSNFLIIKNINRFIIN